MLSKLLYVIERGIEQLVSNSKLLFIAVVLFVFPLLFIVVLEGFYAVSQSIVERSESEQIDVLHDSISALLDSSDDSLRVVVASLSENNPDIQTITVLQELTPDTAEILIDTTGLEVGATSSIATTLRLGAVTPGQTFAIPVELESGRGMQAVRYIQKDSDSFFIFTEHLQQVNYSILEQRKLNTYLLLSLILVFMVGLAYWIYKQTDWQQRYMVLHSSLKERDLFTNMIAHEFRTPLTAIKGYASFLKEAELSEENERYVGVIGDSAQRLVLLVNDFLEVARIQSGKMKLELTTVDVNVVISEVAESLRGEASEKSLELLVEPAVKSVAMQADRNRLIQVITNVVSNAIKYTDTGTVTISTEIDRRNVTVRVQDTGMGISMEDQARIFKPFSRVGGVEKTATTGTGLGMWITKQMVELMNGVIAVESIKGVGTHVLLHFKQDA